MVFGCIPGIQENKMLKLNKSDMTWVIGAKFANCQIPTVCRVRDSGGIESSGFLVVNLNPVKIN